MDEETLQKNVKIADETRKQFLLPGETFEGYYHIGARFDQGEHIKLNNFRDNKDIEKIYRISSGREFVIPLFPNRVMAMNDYLREYYGNGYNRNIFAYAVYSKPRSEADKTTGDANKNVSNQPSG